jgi:O-antigen/teichoic acid export membrane protein
MDCLGNAHFGIREIAANRDRAHEVIGEFIAWRMVGALLMVLIAGAYLTWIGDESRWLAEVLPPACLFVVAYAMFIDWAFRGLERMRSLACAYFTMAASCLALTLLFVRTRGDETSALVAWIVGYACGGLLLLSHLRAKGLLHLTSPRSWGHVRSHLRTSFTFSLAGIMTVSLWQGLVLLLGLAGSERSAGLFAAPLRLVLAVLTAGMILPNAIFPTLANIREEGDLFAETADVFVRVMLVVACPIALVASLWASDALETTVGENYRPMATGFSVLAWSVPLWFVSYALEYRLLARGEETKRLVAIATGAVTLILISMPLVERYDVSGASMAFVLSSAAVTVALVLQMGTDRKRVATVLFKTAMLASASGGVVLATRAVQFEVLGAAVGTVLYLCGLRTFSLVYGSDLEFVRGLLKPTARGSGGS